MDLSKALDPLPLHLRMIKLHACGVSLGACILIRNYPQGRRQIIVIHAFRGEWLQLSPGLPQGFLCGPLHFDVFIDDISNCMVNNSTAMLLHLLYVILTQTWIIYSCNCNGPARKPTLVVDLIVNGQLPLCTLHGKTTKKAKQSTIISKTKRLAPQTNKGGITRTDSLTLS